MKKNLITRIKSEYINLADRLFETHLIWDRLEDEFIDYLADIGLELDFYNIKFEKENKEITLNLSNSNVDFNETQLNLIWELGVNAVRIDFIGNKKSKVYYNKDKCEDKL